jgi:bacteriocin-like protein
MSKDKLESTKKVDPKQKEAGISSVNDPTKIEKGSDGELDDKELSRVTGGGGGTWGG